MLVAPLASPANFDSKRGRPQISTGFKTGNCCANHSRVNGTDNFRRTGETRFSHARYKAHSHISPLIILIDEMFNYHTKVLPGSSFLFLVYVIGKIIY